MLKYILGSCEGKRESEVEGKECCCLHLICNDGSKTDDQHLSSIHHSIKFNVESCQPFTSLLIFLANF